MEGSWFLGCGIGFEEGKIHADSTRQYSSKRLKPRWSPAPEPGEYARTCIPSRVAVPDCDNSPERTRDELRSFL